MVLDDVGQAMTTKILTQNGQVPHRSTHRPLTPEEIADKDGLDAWEQLMARVHEKLGSWVIPWELKDIRQETAPQYNLYEDETQNKQIFPQ